MKRLIYYLVFVVALIFTSCTDDTTEICGNYDTPYIKVARWAATFGEEGGKAEIAFLTNLEEITVAPDEAWFTVVESENIVSITVSANADMHARNGYVRLSGTDGTTTVRDSIYIAQVASCEDLSADGIANCYIAHTGNEYKFDARTKGNGQGDGASLYIENYGLSLSDAVYAELLWEATFDGDRNKGRLITDSQPILHEGYVHFSTGSGEGNAVIAVKDATGTVLWSWHIWVTDEPIEETEWEDYRWMNRNLGALNNTPGDINNRGLLYQWGRKDPFLPSRAEYMVTNFTTLPEANIANYDTGKGMSRWDYTKDAKRLDVIPGNMELSVTQPTWFLTSQSGGDWLAISKIDSYLWAEEEDGAKTIFDPCPAGWHVPPQETFDQPDIKTQWSDFMDNGRIWTGGNGDFFPMAGIRHVNKDLSYCGALSMYWTSTMSSATDTSYRLYLAANQPSAGYIARGYGGNIRCIAE
jgi:hypothetical protein